MLFGAPLITSVILEIYLVDMCMVLNVSEVLGKCFKIYNVVDIPYGTIYRCRKILIALVTPPYIIVCLKN